MIKAPTPNNIALYIIEELGEIEKNLGMFSVVDLQALIQEIEKLDLYFLKGIDLYCDTYFNYIQAEKIVADELPLLKESAEIKPELSHALQKGLELLIKEKDYTYLKIEGLPTLNNQIN